MKATLDFGSLQPIPRCQIQIPSYGTITLRILPEITDTKSANYHDEPVIGRALPITTFSHGENRTISMKCHFIILEDSDAELNFQHLRAIQSAVYPRETQASPYLPPPICRIRCGNLLAGASSDGWLCVKMKSYSITYDTSVAWYSTPNGQGTYLPYKFDVELNWDVVSNAEDLPGQQMIMKDI